MRSVGRAPGLCLRRAHRTSAWRGGGTLSGTAHRQELSVEPGSTQSPGAGASASSTLHPRSTHAPCSTYTPRTPHARPLTFHAPRMPFGLCTAPPSLHAHVEPGSSLRVFMIYPFLGKIPWRRKWQPTPVLFPGEFHGQRWQRATTERLTYTYTIPFFSQKAPLEHLDQAPGSLLFALELKDSLFT